MQRPTRAVTLALVALPLVAAACDFKRTISQSKLEAALGEWLASHQLDATEIHCPEEAQPLEMGHTFECTCEVHGGTIPVTVEVTDPAKGTVEWKPKYLTLTKDSIEKELGAKPQFAGHDLDIDCHDPVWVSIPDSEWSCEIVDKGDGDKKYLATVTFTNGEGAHSMVVAAK